MRTAFLTAALSLSAHFVPAQKVSSGPDDYVWKAIDRYMDQRWLPPARLAGTTQLLLRGIKRAGLDINEVEKLLRLGRRTITSEPEITPGRLTHRLHSLTCEHVDYETSYLLYVPRSYKPDKPCSLVVVAHGGNGAMFLLRAGSAAFGGIRVWVGEAEKHNFILAAPITQRGWGHIGNSVMLSLISKMKRRFRIDPDRVYVTGHSMGGHMTWRSAMGFPDMWAAVAPMSGGYNFVKNAAIYNLFNVAGYATYCTREPYGIDRDNKINGVWLKDQGFDWVSVQGRGSHTILMAEMPKISRFFTEHPRDMYPKQVYLRRSGRLLRDTAPDLAASIKRGWPRVEGWNGAHTWNRERPIDQGMAFWVRLIEPRPLIEKPIVQTVWAENKGDNLIELTTSNVRRLMIYFHPKMIDFDRPVRIVANGKSVFEEKIEVDMFKMLNIAREFDDRGRIYHGMALVKIPDDGEVPIPKRKRR
jgi:pimeloyl-ACP methyl ester carboxylesterase